MQVPLPKRALFFLRSNRNGVALVLVLAFVVLLASILVAFFSRAMAEQQISRASANQTKVKLLVDGAVDTIVGDLKAEIAAGSTDVPITAGGVTTHIYAPKSSTGQTYAQNSGAYTTMLPATQGFTRAAFTAGTPDPLANLVKVSANGAAFYSGGAYTAPGPTRAAASPTNTGPRPISPARWNKPLFLPATSTTDLSPTGSFPIPDWIYVARDGSNKTAPDDTVTGRYAYAVYDEGGLLDINVAGYPSSMAPTAALPDVAYKNALAYADLTQIGLSQAQIDEIIDWRNAASKTTADKYKKYAAFNQAGFLKTVNEDLAAGESDRMFSSRQDLINFLKNKIPGFNKATQDTLQYLTTFSRDLDQPSIIRLQSTNPGKATAAMDYNADAPHVLPQANGGNNFAGQNADDKANPSFLGVQVTREFPRNDGSTARVGEPLVKKRFALNRLAWLTYKGPSAERNLSASGTTGADGDIGLLKQNGITEAWLRLGTRENIRKYFGLTWDTDANGVACWKYNVHNGPSGSATAGPIMMLEDIAALGTPHDPDFFELLKATINVGSLGKALLPLAGSATTMPSDTGLSNPDMEQPYNYNHYAEASVDVQVLQIGANILSQYQTSNYSPVIVFDDGSNSAYMPREIAGVANLPYLNMVITGVLEVKPPLGTMQGSSDPMAVPRSSWDKSVNQYVGAPGSAASGNSGYQGGSNADSITDSGVGVVLQIPVIWNPHDPSSSTGAAGAGPTRLRIVADSTTPDQAAKPNGTHNRIIVYGASQGTTVASGDQQFSYSADASSPGSWYKGLPNIAKEITADKTAIELTQNSGSGSLFPEPTMILTPGPITDSNDNKITVSAGSGSFILNGAPTPVVQGGLPSYFPDNYLGKNAGAPYIGIYLGAFPLAWKYSSASDAAPLSAAQSGAFIARDTSTSPSGAPAGNQKACYFTYRMQYLNSANQWVTYDTKYGKTIDGPIKFKVGKADRSNTPESLMAGNGSISNGVPGSGGYWAFSVDPRSSRFGLLWNGTEISGGKGLSSPFNNSTGYRSIQPLPSYEYENKDGGWLDKTNGVTLSARPDRCPGFFTIAGWPFNGGGVQTGPGKVSSTDGGASAGWMAWISTDSGSVGGCFPGVHPGMLSQNNADVVSYYRRFTADIGGGDGYTQTPEYFADPDGMVRRGMGAFIPPGPTQRYPNPLVTYSVVGLPMTRAFPYRPSVPHDPDQDQAITEYSNSTKSTQSQAQSRPYFLHRPFRTVAELGYVFSDTPWRDLDLSTAESGAPALLDVFCINESSDPDNLVAGKVNLNTRQTPVLKSILASAYLDPALASGSAVTARIDAGNTADLVAKALVARTLSTTGNLGPLRNVSELVGRWIGNTTITHPNVSGVNKTPLSQTDGFYDGKVSYSGFSDGGWDISKHAPKISSPPTDIYSAYQSSGAFSSNGNYNGTRETVSYIQRFREAPIRALSAAGQTRVWNLMIDLIAQAGRFPTGATSMDRFQVSGEQRYWVHLAIDRLTGRVIDKQIEVVKE